MADRAKAWVLDVGGPILIAISEHEMVEVLETSVAHPVPRGPNYCQQVIQRHNEVIPLLDLARVASVDHHDQPNQDQPNGSGYTVILAYQTSTEAMVSRAGLLIRRAPRGIAVSDEMEVVPPSGLPNAWRDLMIACFSWQGTPVMVPDLGRLLVPEE